VTILRSSYGSAALEGSGGSKPTAFSIPVGAATAVRGRLRQAAETGKSGFTLLELVIALTIMGLMAGIVFSSFRLAMNSYVKSQVEMERGASRRILKGQIRRQVGSLFPLRPVASFNMAGPDSELMEGADPTRAFAPLFYGSPDSVVFITVTPLVDFDKPGLTVVRYGPAQDEYGDSYLGSMEAPFVGLDSFVEMVQVPRGKPLPLIEDVSQIEFEYYGYDPETQIFDWYSEWFGEERRAVPTAIRILYDKGEVLAIVNASFFGGQIQSGVRNLLGRTN